MLLLNPNLKPLVTNFWLLSYLLYLLLNTGLLTSWWGEPEGRNLVLSNMQQNPPPTIRSSGKYWLVLDPVPWVSLHHWPA